MHTRMVEVAMVGLIPLQDATVISLETCGEREGVGVAEDICIAVGLDIGTTATAERESQSKILSAALLRMVSVCVVTCPSTHYTFM